MWAFYRLLDIKYLFCRLSAFAAVFFRFSLHSLFVPRNLCVKHYASFCIFMQSKNVYLYNIRINRKLWGIFEFYLAPLRKRPIFLLFVFSLFLLFWINYRKQKRKRKSLIFSVFAWKRPFLSQIKRLFSVIYAYIGQTTPHTPTFGTRRVGQLSSENFLFFYFLFFVKYYDFANSAFLLNFCNFWEYNIYFYFCIKFHSIYFCLFLWLLWRFM